MAKPGKNKPQCEKYRKSGHREENKRLRKLRHEKRMAKFAKRRADGKAYEYKPNPYKEGTVEYNRENAVRHDKCVNKRKTPYQRLRSFFDKLNNEISKAEKAAKREAERIKGSKTNNDGLGEDY